MKTAEAAEITPYSIHPTKRQEDKETKSREAREQSRQGEREEERFPSPLPLFSLSDGEEKWEEARSPSLRRTS